MDIDKLCRRIEDREALIGIVGLGYVGLPLMLAFCDKGFRTLGFDIKQQTIESLLAGRSYIAHIPSETIAKQVQAGRIDATIDFARIAECDAVLICVPTPLTRHREPDLSYVLATTESIAPHLKPGVLVVLESTTYPGTTDEEMKPILEKYGLKEGTDFFIAYSPEREDPGRDPSHSAAAIPKVVGADSEAARKLAVAVYKDIVAGVVPVSSTRTAEAVKLTENIFRSVNIALVNELKMVYSRMGINVWEVIDAAKTKPFGFMPFYPGPGLGGHCIPIDPFYLTWKAREYEMETHFIELAGEVNASMPQYVIDQLTLALNERCKSLKGSRILVLGMAYKKDVDDTRESPSLRIFEMLLALGCEVEYYDPFIPEIPLTREHPDLTGRRSVAWTPETLAAFDAALILTDHSDVNYRELVAHAPLVVDTRNATREVTANRDRIVLA